jgi:glyoxylate carboligase
MIAACAHALAGDATRAASWAANVRERAPALSREDFFRSLPMRPGPVRARVDAALARLGL